MCYCNPAIRTPCCGKPGCVPPGSVVVPQAEHILQFFEYSHLPKHLQEVSRPFGELARYTLMTLPKNPERSVALRKLLEAKDAAVRAVIAK